jgi:hypothetical protein
VVDLSRPSIGPSLKMALPSGVSCLAACAMSCDGAPTVIVATLGGW